MIAVFIDTNIYEEMDYNFNDKNSVLQAFKKLVAENEVKNVVISVIDGEVKKHLEDRQVDSRRAIKKYCKWINCVVKEDIIKENLNKEFMEYEEFKKETKAEILKIDNINSQRILEKYFAEEPPFESRKKFEFKDAFFVEAILEYIKKKSYIRVAVITKDQGIGKAINKFGTEGMKVFKSIQELVDFVINYGEKRKRELVEYVKNYDLKSLIVKEYSLDYCDMKEENIEVDDIDIMGIYNMEILNDLTTNVIAVCDIGVALKGKFSCLDYENSFYSYEEKKYLYKSYINKNELMFVCTTVVSIEKNDCEYGRITIKDFPEIEISYENMNSDVMFI